MTQYDIKQITGTNDIARGVLVKGSRTLRSVYVDHAVDGGNLVLFAGDTPIIPSISSITVNNSDDTSAFTLTYTETFSINAVRLGSYQQPTWNALTKTLRFTFGVSGQTNINDVRDHIAALGISGLSVSPENPTGKLSEDASFGVTSPPTIVEPPAILRLSSKAVHQVLDINKRCDGGIWYKTIQGNDARYGVIYS